MTNEDILIEDLTNLLREAVDTIEDLATQQAMEDNFYQSSLKRIKDKLKELNNVN